NMRRVNTLALGPSRYHHCGQLKSLWKYPIKRVLGSFWICTDFRRTTVRGMLPIHQYSTYVVQYRSRSPINVMIKSQHIISDRSDVDGFDARETKRARFGDKPDSIFSIPLNREA